MLYAPQALTAQAVFRALLEAMSRPGRAVPLPAISPEQNSDLLAILETLLDHEVSFCVVDGGKDSVLCQIIATATGARGAAATEADFLVVLGLSSNGVVRQARRGCLEYPDKGATIIYDLSAGVTGVNHPPVHLSGPGICEPEGRSPDISGPDSEEWRALAHVNADYPLGVDVFILDGAGRVMAVPRSTYIAVH